MSHTHLRELLAVLSLLSYIVFISQCIGFVQHILNLLPQFIEKLQINHVNKINDKGIIPIKNKSTDE